MSSLLPAIMGAQSSTTKVLLDPTFRTPAAPGDAFIQDPHHVSVVKTILLAISLLFVAVSVSEARGFQTTVPFALAVSGIFCVVPEAVNNYIGGVYWIQSHNPKQNLFMLRGREFDYYGAIIWWSFASGVGLGLHAALMRGVSTAKLWGILALAVVADIILEEVLLTYGGIYLLIRSPAFDLELVPCWWGFANVTSLFLGISLAFRYRMFFEGWRGVFFFFFGSFGADLLYRCLDFLRYADHFCHPGRLRTGGYGTGWTVYLSCCGLAECRHDASRTRTQFLDVGERPAEEKTIDGSGLTDKILQTPKVSISVVTVRIR